MSSNLRSVSSREEKAAPRKRLYFYECDCVQGQVWEQVNQKGEVFQTVEFRRVLKNGSESRFPNSFYPRDSYSLPKVIYDCMNWLSVYLGEHDQEDE